jgi:DNA polymerase-3 subunit gamma/tau
MEISQGRSMDVIEIDGASNRGIDEIRTLRENVKFSPTGGKYKIYIIDEVHMLTQEAFNALLKTLEEPPKFVKFIFATTQPQKVIPTILSRCQRFDFRRIPVMESIAQLEKIVAEERINVDKEVLLAIAKSSDGSLRDAESVLDQLVSFSKNKISLKDVISVLGLIEQDTLFEITDKIIQKDPRGALGLFNNIIDEGKDISLFLNNLIEHFRNLMVTKVAKADPQLIDLPPEVCEKLFQQSQAFTLEEIFSAFNIFVNTQEISKRLDSLRIPLEISLVKLAQDKKGHNPSTIKESFSKEKEKTNTAHPMDNPKVIIEDNPPASEGPTQTVSLDGIRSAWSNIVDTLRKTKISVATYLNEGDPVRLEKNTLTVSFPKNYSLHKETLDTQVNRAIIEKTIFELLNARVRLYFVLSAEVANKKEDTAHTPFLQSALDMFKGRIVKEE